MFVFPLYFQAILFQLLVCIFSHIIIPVPFYMHFLKYYLFFKFIIVQLQLPHLFPHCSPLSHFFNPTVNPAPPPLPMPRSPLFMFLCLPPLLLSHIIPLRLHSGHCQFVLYVQVSGLFCSFVLLIRFHF